MTDTASLRRQLLGAKRRVSLPLPVPSTEDFIRLVHRHALRCIVGITWQLISITQPALEVILKMIERPGPGPLVLSRPGQGREKRCRSLEVLLPECCTLVGILQLSAGRAGPRGVESVDTAGLLVDGDGAGKVRPQPSDDTTGTLGRQGVVSNAEVRVLERVLGQKAEEVAIDALEISSMLISVEETADCELRCAKGSDIVAKSFRHHHRVS